MDKKNLWAEHTFRVFWLRLKKGFSKIRNNPKLIIIVTLYWSCFYVIASLYHPMDFISHLMWIIAFPLINLATLAIFLAFVIILATPRGAARMSRDLRRAGLVNSVGEPPVLLDLLQQADNREIAILINCGISLSQYQDLTERIETALNRRITKIEEGSVRNTICMHLAPSDAAIPQKINWSDNFLNHDDFALSLGVGLNGIYTVNLNTTPHLLIAGSTGSGKSVLIKNIIYQSLNKNADVYLIDLKGGLDFPNDWKQSKCSFCDEQQSALSLLSHIANELAQRKITLSLINCPNIAVYNQRYSNQMKHIIVVLDEIAELTDTTGLDKPHKDIVYATISHLSTLARMGRAYGIHLIIGTQRPDATILPGQIKNNCDIRICGRADNTLSMIILDNTNAADKIPKDSQGRFLSNDGTEFQGFWFSV